MTTTPAYKRARILHMDWARGATITARSAATGYEASFLGTDYRGD